ncbi:MAG: GTPase [Candidatus Kapaibacteriales bacterium]
MLSKVILISGFLGSGKTTLINKILEANYQSNNWKLAVLENEFGSIGIDERILRDEGREIRQVQGGCVCCTEQGKMVQELEYLNENGFEIILIECSGVADPSKVAAELFRPYLDGRIEYVGTICLIDALNFNRYKSEELAQRQISFANILIQTKSDLNKEEVEFVKNLSDSPIVENVDAFTIKDILNKNHRKPKKLLDSLSQIPQYESFDTFTLYLEIPFIREEFEYAINAILKSDEFYRIKGLISFENDNEDTIWLFESVGFSGTLKPLQNEITDRKFLVFIGKKPLDKSNTEGLLKEALLSF